MHVQKKNLFQLFLLFAFACSRTPVVAQKFYDNIHVHTIRNTSDLRTVIDSFAIEQLNVELLLSMLASSRSSVYKRNLQFTVIFSKRKQIMQPWQHLQNMQPILLHLVLQKSSGISIFSLSLAFSRFHLGFLMR